MKLKKSSFGMDMNGDAVEIAAVMGGKSLIIASENALPLKVPPYVCSDQIASLLTFA